ncbi:MULTISPECIES: aldose 1-epimerase family protein [unclassified Microbacterium]|uniref:aldose 1-epimerase family protein n=1 Tax=unclassified Microbacterium TaxID=2609290 RepID=UPI003652F654
MTTPTGVQVHLEANGVRAQISQVGASLRHLLVGDTTVVPPYPDDSPAPSCSGVVLVPWPNRIRDGIWVDGDETRALAITEPKLNNAIHGLLRYTAYEIAEQSDATVLLRADVVPQIGYPYLLETSVRYTLGVDGVTVEHTIVNRSEDPAPVALGTHPFLTVSDVDPKQLLLRIPAETFFETDDRLLPVGESPVSGGTDLRMPRRLADVQLDTGFATLRREEDGRVHSTLTAPDGRVVTLWQGAGLDYLQAYTSTSYPGQELVVALEPMSAPAEAFNSGRGLRHLAPGETWTAQWGVTLTNS